jgi:mRNA interferase RelE/StbE
MPTALKTLKEITDRRVREQILKRIDRLYEDAEKQGKPLLGELAKYRTIRAINQRYRIIYCVDNGMVKVLVAAIGIRKEGDRKDVYRLAQRLVRLGLIG